LRGRRPRLRDARGATEAGLPDPWASRSGARARSSVALVSGARPAASEVAVAPACGTAA
jgi:hypothetical protein